MAIATSNQSLDLDAAPRTPGDFVFRCSIAICGWCWSNFMLVVGMRWPDFTNTWLKYSQEPILLFFVLRQPVMIVIAFFVVQWRAGIAIQLPVVVLSSVAVTVGLYERIVKRIGPPQSVLGMKAGWLDKAQVGAMAGSEE